MPDPTNRRTLLAIETADRWGSIALARVDPSGDAGGAAVAEQRELPRDKRSAESLAPAIAALLRGAGLRAGEIDAVAVAVGPGSFTGLRVGVTTAKTLAYAADALAVAVSTLDALAEPHLDRFPRVWAALDAQRGEVFAARYDGGVAQPAEPTTRVSRSGLAERLRPGDALVSPIAAELIAEAPGVEAIEAGPDAAAVARLGAAALVAGETVDPFALMPDYCRLSAAEEKAAGG